MDTAATADSLGDEIVELYIFKSVPLGGRFTKNRRKNVCVFWYLSPSLVIQRELILTELNSSLHCFGKTQFYWKNKKQQQQKQTKKPTKNKNVFSGRQKKHSQQCTVVYFNRQGIFCTYIDYSVMSI